MAGAVKFGDVRIAPAARAGEGVGSSGIEVSRALKVAGGKYISRAVQRDRIAVDGGAAAAETSRPDVMAGAVQRGDISIIIAATVKWAKPVRIEAGVARKRPCGVDPARGVHC